jgi:DNA-binding IclR family transcriptional regulator
VVFGGQGEIGPPNRPAFEAQAIERLWAGHLVEQVKVDVEQVRLAIGPADQMSFPDLLSQRPGHPRHPFLLPIRRLGTRLTGPASDTVHSNGFASHALRRQYQCMDNSSGVGVLDKAATVLSALEAGPATLAQLVGATGLARPTAHRLAVALEHHRLVTRDMQGRFVLGPRLAELASAAGEDRLLAAAGPVLGALRDHTNESAQLFRRQGDTRICVAAAERPMGLRDTIPVGASLSMLAGSGAQILLAWEEPDRLHRGLQGARFNATALSAVRRRGWAQSVGEREPGVASVSAPVRGPSGRVVAAVSISGPIERLSRQPGRLHAATVVAGANKLTEVLRRAHQSSQG